MKTYIAPTTLAIRLENACSLCQAASPAPTGDGITINSSGSKIIESE